MFQQALTFILPLSSCSTYVTAFPTTGPEIERSWREGWLGWEGEGVSLEFSTWECGVEELFHSPPNKSVSDIQHWVGFLTSTMRWRQKGSFCSIHHWDVGAELMELVWSLCSPCCDNSRQNRPYKKPQTPTKKNPLGSFSVTRANFCCHF